MSPDFSHYINVLWGIFESIREINEGEKGSTIKAQWKFGDPFDAKVDSSGILRTAFSVTESRT